MSERAKRRATHEDLTSVPERMIREIIGGELIVTPRPSKRHARAMAALSAELTPPYDFGRGGPGGWIILIEPEVGLGADIVVPDLAGWRSGRLPESEENSWISIVPDWVCEVLSTGTVRTDRITKASLYRQYGVPYLWLIDPIAKTLEVFGLDAGSGTWVVRGLYGEDDKVRAEPFAEIEIELRNLWWRRA